MTKTNETLENLDEELRGSIDFEVVDVSEGQLIRLKDGTLLDPEIFVSYFSDLSAFEEEFGPLQEAREKLREVKKLEEEFGPVSELSEALNKIYERAEALLESYHDHGVDDEEDYYEDLDDEDLEEEEYDVSDLTVKQLLSLLVSALMDEEGGEADNDVDLEDLDLERIGNMTVGDLLQLLREGRVEEVLESSHEEGGCGCGNKGSTKKLDLDKVVEKLFEEADDGDGLPVTQPTLGLVEEPNVERKEEEGEEKKEKEKEKEEQGEKEDRGEDEGEEAQDQAVRVKTEGFDLDLFKRLLDRLG